ncbi:MAG: hypothetical protein Ta2D_01550 [Rickettsiales bacterium]|nr:MAG: hypothetical protein Ta2D_01550 [Rickettsiales bacterium]
MNNCNNNNFKRNEPLLPPPEVLKRYNEIYGGLTEELIELVKKEQAQRHKIQNSYLWHFRIGQIFSIVFFIYICKYICHLIDMEQYAIVYVMIALLFAILIISIHKYKINRNSNTQIKKPIKNFKNNNNYRR